MAYLTYMAMRLMEMHRVLKNSGSIYLHCDPTASHYLKVVMDCVFGTKNFCNEIAWCYSNSGRSKNKFAQKHDIIFLYGKSKNCYWSDYRVPVSDKYLASHYRHKDGNGKQCRIRNDHGKTRIYYPEDGVTCNDWWVDIDPINSQAKERLGYPTQKPVSLLKRIILASSNKGDIVLDPFCGCATTCVAAQQEQRQWIGIDIEEHAAPVLRERLEDDSGIFSDFIHRTDIPQRTDIKTDKRDKLMKAMLYVEQDEICVGCGGKHDMKLMEIDHIVPRSKGGGDYRVNYQLLCSHCNRVKGAKTMDYLKARLARFRPTL